jgi:hypothetical protein
LGEHPVTIDSIGWCMGKYEKKQILMETFDIHAGASPPKRLEHGECATFLSATSTDGAANWAAGFVRDVGGFPLRSLRGRVSTTTGFVLEIKPDARLIAALQKELDAQAGASKAL